jgi:hypothetical protein
MEFKEISDEQWQFIQPLLSPLLKPEKDGGDRWL